MLSIATTRPYQRRGLRRNFSPLEGEQGGPERSVERQLERQLAGYEAEADDVVGKPSAIPGGTASSGRVLRPLLLPLRRVALEGLGTGKLVLQGQ